MAPLIHWFRRDLRLSDNTALTAAANDGSGAVLPVFILDDALLSGRFAGPARIRFMLQSLRALDDALRERGSGLVFRHGDPQQILLALLEESGATGVYWNRDYSPYAIKRDTAIKQALKDGGYSAHSFKDVVVWEMDEITSKSDTPYSVFTPYSRVWHHRIRSDGFDVHAVPELIWNGERPPSHPIPELSDLGLHTDQTAIPGGETEGRRLLSEFTDMRRNNTIAGYDEQRNVPGIPGTSRMSAHLRLGTVSPRTCLQAALDTTSQHANAADGVDTWVNELAWRDFYAQVLYHNPHVLCGAFKPEYDALEWENDEDHFAAWCEGRTGYPIVDAAMRQINTIAWMHNRSRMIVASFLTKDLLVDWRWGERYFMQHLVDGDPASNNGGWQWAAGTGTDAQPYFRIFNPVSQGEKFDPEGAYVRRYVPELANVPPKYIHQPHTMPAEVQRECGVEIGRDYPDPIVDHKEQRQRALEMYKAVK